MALWVNRYEDVTINKTSLIFPEGFIYDYVQLFTSEGVVKDWLEKFRKHLHRHFRGFAFSASILAAYDWDKERIDFESMEDQLKEFNFVEKLKSKAVCQLCKKRILIGNTRVEGVEYCTCDRKQLEVLRLAEKQNGNDEGWEPYIERKKMITWRREEKPGLYAYKVYVEYSDISAEDFLFVQTDIGYRKKWDETAISLEIIDSEENTNSEVIYWEMLWPKLFNNRDYVYNRRYIIDKTNNVIIIVNKSTQHPKCPPMSSKQRVHEYWSYMVIRPTTSFSKPGLEFVLTYFDNPGLSIPKSITTWVAQRQMPDFLDKLHQATLNYAAMKNFSKKRSVSIQLQLLNVRNSFIFNIYLMLSFYRETC